MSLCLLGRAVKLPKRYRKRLRSLKHAAIVFVVTKLTGRKFCILFAKVFGLQSQFESLLHRAHVRCYAVEALSAVILDQRRQQPLLRFEVGGQNVLQALVSLPTCGRGCGARGPIPVGPHVPAHRPFFASGHQCSVIVGVLHRQHGGAPLDVLEASCAEVASETQSAFGTIGRWLAIAFFDHEDPSAKEWRKGLPGPKRRMYNKAAADTWTHTHLLPEPGERRIATLERKWEAQWHGKIARLICASYLSSRPASYDVKCVSKLLYKVFGLDGDFVYAAGPNSDPLKLGDWIEEGLCSIPGGVFVTRDTKKQDRDMSCSLRLAVCDLLEPYLTPVVARLMREMSQGFTGRYSSRRGEHWSFSSETDHGVASGESFTTLVNTVVNLVSAMVLVQLAKAAGLPGRIRALCLGDDFWAIMDVATAEFCRSLFARRFMGFEFEYSVDTDIARSEFCSKRLTPTLVNGELRYLFVPKLGRILWKTFYGKKDARAVACAVLSSSWPSPILAPLMRALGGYLKSDQEPDHKLHIVYSDEHVACIDLENSATMAATAFCSRYGVTVDSVKRQVLSQGVAWPWEIDLTGPISAVLATDVHPDAGQAAVVG